MDKESGIAIALRYLHILELLAGGGGDCDKGRGFTRKHLQERLEALLGFEVNTRALQRDLSTLSALGWIKRSSVRPFPVSTASRDKLLRMLTVAEAMSLVLLEDRLRPLMPRRLMCVLDVLFFQARSTLESHKRNGHEANLIDRLFVAPDSLAMRPAEVDEQTLQTVQDALINGTSLTLTYQARDHSEPRQRRVRPAGLFLKGPTTYLVAQIDGKDVLTRFALHRVVKAEPLEAVLYEHEPAPLPQHFDFRKWCLEGGSDFGDGQQIEVEFLAAPLLTKVLKETPLTERMSCEELPDGRGRFRCTVPQSDQLLRWLLSQGLSVEVVAPQSLRAQLSAALLQAAALYK